MWFRMSTIAVVQNVVICRCIPSSRPYKNRSTISFCANGITRAFGPFLSMSTKFVSTYLSLLPTIPSTSNETKVGNISPAPNPATTRPVRLPDKRSLRSTSFPISTSRDTWSSSARKKFINSKSFFQYFYIKSVRIRQWSLGRRKQTFVEFRYYSILYALVNWLHYPHDPVLLNSLGSSLPKVVKIV